MRHTHRTAQHETHTGHIHDYILGTIVGVPIFLAIVLIGLGIL